MSDLSHDTHLLDLLPAYALGSLDADELQRVEEHLLSCWICRNDLSAFQMIADELSLAAFAFSHVMKDDGKASAARLADARDVQIKLSIQGSKVILEANTFAGLNDATVHLKPGSFGIGKNLERAFAYRACCRLH